MPQRHARRSDITVVVLPCVDKGNPGNSATGHSLGVRAATSPRCGLYGIVIPPEVTDLRARE